MYPISFEEDFVFFTSYIIFNNDYGSGTQEELNVMEVVQKKWKYRICPKGGGRGQTPNPNFFVLILVVLK